MQSKVIPVEEAPSWADVKATVKKTNEDLNKVTENIDRVIEVLNQSIEERKVLLRRWDLENKMREEEYKKREEERKMREEQERKKREEEDKKREKEDKRREEERKAREARYEEERRKFEEEYKEREKRREKENKEANDKFNKLLGSFTSQWGRLVEEICKPAALKLFRELGIGIKQVYKDARKGSYYNSEMEVDIILCNTTVAVAVEVKTTCKVEDVQYFLEKMPHFKEVFHPFASCTVYGAIAALKYDESSDIYARRKGLFVLHANSEEVFLLEKPRKLTEF